MIDIIVTPEIAAGLRATAHVRRRGKLGRERLDEFLARVGLTLEQCRTWSRQAIANHVYAAEAREKFLIQTQTT